MNTRRYAGLALLAGLAMLGGCTTAQPVAEPEPVAAVSVGEAAEAVSSSAAEESVGEAASAEMRTGLFACSRGGDPATLLVRPDGSCSRFPGRFPASSTRYCVENVCPGCRSLAQEIGCNLTE